MFLLVGIADFRYTLANGKEPLEERAQNVENDGSK